MMPPMTTLLEQHLSESTNPQPQHLYGDMECPSGIAELRQGTNVDDRSLCPWYYIMNHDPDRYPYDLVEAECRCRHSCVGLPPESGTGCEKMWLLLMAVGDNYQTEARRHHRHRQIRTKVVCRNKSIKELKTEWRAYLDHKVLHSSYAMLPFLRDNIQPALHRSTDSRRSTSVNNSISQDCPILISNLDLGGSTIQRSLCPAFVVINQDFRRYPVDLTEVDCHCKERCVGLLPEGGAGCEKMYYNVPVLRKTHMCDANRKYIFKRGWQRLAVGCTCAIVKQS
ncbi:hypothetical protein LSH36_727g01016 [Paralvinella palmiformis]|uniref:Uncharacterized protein n=1 Tax=Paralvinella palmiformis TaxID=53620 RepID=A0AAD9J2H2_9ANNE|nr:hypothetical protein LSH36_727g01016 [Paralvinella palmiformis]